MRITELNFTSEERDWTPEQVSGMRYQKIVPKPISVMMGTEQELKNAQFETTTYKIHKFNNGVDKNMFFVAVREDQERYLHTLSDVNNTAFRAAVRKELDVELPRRTEALLESWIRDYKDQVNYIFNKMSFIEKIFWVFGWQKRSFPGIPKYY